jgi:hypothetical protein
MTETSARSAAQPATELAELDFFIGEWEAEGTFFTTPFSTEKSIRMNIETRRDLKGFWVLTRTAEQPTADNLNPLEASYVWGYDTANGQYIAEWFDSNGGRAHQESPGWDSDRLVFTGTMTSGGFTFALRDTFTRRTNGYHHLGEVDLGAGWIPVDEEAVRRREKSR